MLRILWTALLRATYLEFILRMAQSRLIYSTFNDNTSLGFDISDNMKRWFCFFNQHWKINIIQLCSSSDSATIHGYYTVQYILDSVLPEVTGSESTEPINISPVPDGARSFRRISWIRSSSFSEHFWRKIRIRSLTNQIIVKSNFQWFFIWWRWWTTWWRWRTSTVFLLFIFMYPFSMYDC